jgi:hypothetical protein
MSEASGSKKVGKINAANNSGPSFAKPNGTIISSGSMFFDLNINWLWPYECEVTYSATSFDQNVSKAVYDGRSVCIRHHYIYGKANGSGLSTKFECKLADTL